MPKTSALTAMPHFLNINEIFYSIQGESSRSGLPTVFIRLTGCPLRCNYCDTEYAFKGKNEMSIEAIIEQIKLYNTPYICVTGGEPLAQKKCFDLLNELIKLKYQVSLETSGSIDISQVNEAVMVVMDLKTPSSGEQNSNLLSNINLLKPKDEVKFVIANQADFNWARQMLNKHQFNTRVLFSPVAQQLSPTTLAQWILEKQLLVRLQIQLHKSLWGDARGR